MKGNITSQRLYYKWKFKNLFYLGEMDWSPNNEAPAESSSVHDE